MRGCAQLALHAPQELYPFGNFGATFTTEVGDVPQEGRGGGGEGGGEAPGGGWGGRGGES